MISRKHVLGLLVATSMGTCLHALDAAPKAIQPTIQVNTKTLYDYAGHEKGEADDDFDTVYRLKTGTYIVEERQQEVQGYSPGIHIGTDTTLRIEPKAYPANGVLYNPLNILLDGGKMAVIAHGKNNVSLYLGPTDSVFSSGEINLQAQDAIAVECESAHTVQIQNNIKVRMNIMGGIGFSCAGMTRTKFIQSGTSLIDINVGNKGRGMDFDGGDLVEDAAEYRQKDGRLIIKADNATGLAFGSETIFTQQGYLRGNSVNGGSILDFSTGLYQSHFDQNGRGQAELTTKGKNSTAFLFNHGGGFSQSGNAKMRINIDDGATGLIGNTRFDFKQSDNARIEMLIKGDNSIGFHITPAGSFVRQTNSASMTLTVNGKNTYGFYIAPEKTENEQTDKDDFYDMTFSQADNSSLEFNVGSHATGFYMQGSTFEKTGGVLQLNTTDITARALYFENSNFNQTGGEVVLNIFSPARRSVKEKETNMPAPPLVIKGKAQFGANAIITLERIWSPQSVMSKAYDTPLMAIDGPVSIDKGARFFVSNAICQQFNPTQTGHHRLILVASQIAIDGDFTLNFLGKPTSRHEPIDEKLQTCRLSLEKGQNGKVLFLDIAAK